MSQGYGFFAPEVIQTSAMDCGPAALKSFLQAFGLDCNYEGLREACQTSLDGSSINTIEEICVDLGLDVVQHVVPQDLFLDALTPRLPAVVVSREANGPHFIVLWKVVGNWVQIMDPGAGRRWLTREALLSLLFSHDQRLAPPLLRDWLPTSSFAGALLRRARSTLPRPVAERLIARLGDGTDWRAWSALDATVRIVHGSGRRNDEVARGAEDLFALALAEATAPLDERLVPDPLWALRPTDGGVWMRCVVFLASRQEEQPRRVTGATKDDATERAVSLTVARKSASVFHELFVFLRRQAAVAFVFLLLGVVIASASSLVEFFLFRAALSPGHIFEAPVQRLVLCAALVTYFAVLLGLDSGINYLLSSVGRRYELHLRTEILLKTARLGERYVSSRPIMDLAQRAHRIYLVRELPEALFGTLRLVLDLLLTMSAISLISLRVGLMCLVGTLVTTSLLVFASRILLEVDSRYRSQAGALLEMFLEALLGAVPIRTHDLTLPLHAEQETLLGRWFETGRTRVSVNALASSGGSLLTKALAVGAVVVFALTAHDQQALVLMILWALRLPVEIQALALRLEAYPNLRNVLLRVIEPLRISESAAEADPLDAGKDSAAEDDIVEAVDGAGVGIALRNVTVLAGGHPILRNVSLTIAPGEQVAIVGKSGAGKSSLIALLLGLYAAEEGIVEIDGLPLTRASSERLHEVTAWVDPAVQLWNHSLLYNVQYGSYREATRAVSSVLAQSDLVGVLERLEQGLRTSLGSGGSRLSGGEGQRVRFARAIHRTRCRLVLFDEPFRGLDREARATLTKRARLLVGEATLLCATHDIHRTLDFTRVLVVEDGRIVEDGRPADLAARDGKYRALLDAEVRAQQTVWMGSWKRLYMEDGRLSLENDAAT